MINITYIEGNNYFSINGKKRPQIYQAVAMGTTDIAIYSIHDIKNRLLGNTHYSEVRVNDVEYTTQDELITTLIPILYRRGSSGSGGTGDSTDWQSIIDLKEDKFNKNTAFNKDFGSSQGTVAEGNDPRFSQGTTAFGWGEPKTTARVININIADLETVDEDGVIFYLANQGYSKAKLETLIINIGEVEGQEEQYVVVILTPTEGGEITGAFTTTFKDNSDGVNISNITEGGEVAGDFTIKFNGL